MGTPIIEKLGQAMDQKGCIVTFCGKGEVRRLLKQCGFAVESLKGPPGKREITRAVKY